MAVSYLMAYPVQVWHEAMNWKVYRVEPGMQNRPHLSALTSCELDIRFDART